MIAGMVSLFACGQGETKTEDADATQQEVMQADEQTEAMMEDEMDAVMDTTQMEEEEAIEETIAE